MKKVITVITTALLCMTMLVLAPTQVIASAAENNGKKYISEVKVGMGEDSDQASKELLAEGYTIFKDNSGNYAEAAKWFKDVIDNGKSVGGEKLALVDDYLWNSDDAHENNKEAVFELQFAKGNANAGYFAAYGWGWNDGATPDHRNWRWKLMCPSPVGWGDFCAETWLVYAFKNEKTVKNTPRTTAGQFDQRLECSLFYLDIWKDYPGHAQWQWGEGYEEKVDAGELEAPGWYNNGSYWTGDRVFQLVRG